MPYITSSHRELIHNRTIRPISAGELNFLFTDIANEYLEKEGLSYSRLNDIIGALEGAKMELYRRVAAFYETAKRHENGDVYSKKVLEEAKNG